MGPGRRKDHVMRLVISLALLAVLALITYVPALVLFLPNLLMG